MINFTMYFYHSIHIIGYHGNNKIVISPCDFFRGWGRIGEVGVHNI